MRLIAVTLLLTCASIAHAEIEKIAIPSNNGVNFHWWPKMEAAVGWHHDRKFSIRYGANAHAPDGHTFASAEAVMYARALYKLRMPGVHALAQLIASDHREFEARDSGLRISEFAVPRGANGLELDAYKFEPGQSENWEVVAYGEEDDFYFIFTVSARSEQALRNAMPAFREFVASYGKTP